MTTTNYDSPTYEGLSLDPMLPGLPVVRQPQSLTDVQKSALQKLYPYGRFWSNASDWGFMQLSVEGGAAYKNGKDSEGALIFQKHRKESKTDGNVRRSRSSVFNYCDFFATRFHAYATSKSVARSSSSDQDWKTFSEDADGAGQSFDEFMLEVRRAALEVSPIWMGIDTPMFEGNPDGSELTLQQQRDLDLRPNVFWVDPRNVVDYDAVRGKITRVVVRESYRMKFDALLRESEQIQFVEWTPSYWRRFLQVEAEGDHFKVLQIAAGVNPVGEVPYRPLHFSKPRRGNPLFSSSMIHDCATIQRDIYRILSLYFEELFNRTFSTQVIAGATSDEIGSQLSQTLIVLEDPEARVAAAGADTKQAMSLLDALKWLIRNLFRVAQFESSGDPMEVATRSAESGKKKARDLEGLYQTLTRYSIACQRAENDLIRLWEKVMDKEPNSFATSSYPTDFNIQSVREMIEEVMLLQEAEFPTTFVLEQMRAAMKKVRPQMDERTRKAIEAELESQTRAAIESVLDEEPVPGQAA